MFVFSIAIVIIIITSREFINLPTGFRDAGNLGLIVFFFFFFTLFSSCLGYSFVLPAPWFVVTKASFSATLCFLDLSTS